MLSPLISKGNNPITYRILFYNVENLFDVEDNPLTIDEEFLPKGDRFWTEAKFYAKLDRIFQVIMAASEGNKPALIGLCEIENRKVLDLLLHKTPLGKMSYGIIHKESPDKRGIDVALLYQKELFHPISFYAYELKNPADNSFKTRDILYVKGRLESDTLQIFINHWPSKFGGTVETMPLRELAAKKLSHLMDSLFIINQKSRIIAMGDFNDTPFDESITKHLMSGFEKDKPQLAKIINLSTNLARQGKGTIKYQGKWELIDQVFVSKSLQNDRGITAKNYKIFDAPFLLEEDKRYLGEKPFRTYIGFTYNNGFSDHLPITFDLVTVPIN